MFHTPLLSLLRSVFLIGVRETFFTGKCSALASCVSRSSTIHGGREKKVTTKLTGSILNSSADPKGGGQDARNNDIPIEWPAAPRKSSHFAQKIAPAFSVYMLSLVITPRIDSHPCSTILSARPCALTLQNDSIFGTQ
jgi:hypothetical protein